MPAYHFHEVHSTRVQASPDRVFRAIKVVTAEEIQLLRALMRIRAFPARLLGERAGSARLTTETRIFATDAAAAKKFAVYWRVIYPGSAVIRRMWLKAIKRRAELESRG